MACMQSELCYSRNGSGTVVLGSNSTTRNCNKERAGISADVKMNTAEGVVWDEQSEVINRSRKEGGRHQVMPF